MSENRRDLIKKAAQEVKKKYWERRRAEQAAEKPLNQRLQELYEQDLRNKTEYVSLNDIAANLPPKPEERIRAALTKHVAKVCNDCGYVAKGEGLAMLEDFIAHRIAHPEWNSWVGGWFTESPGA